MSIKASVYIATSLDGFIARSNGAIDWLSGWEASPNDGDYGYQVFMDTVDVIVLGRNTFETALTFGAWPYKKKVVVLSTKAAPDLPILATENIEWLSLPPQDLVDHLAAQGAQGLLSAKHLYVDGGTPSRNLALPECRPDQ
jgi:dihydrofolate reductase